MYSNKKTTILNKKPKGFASKAYANSSIFSGDLDGDKNISGPELAVDASLALIGGGSIAKNALKKIAGRTSVKRIGKGISNFFNNYINPSSGKSIANQAKGLIKERDAILNSGGVIPKKGLGRGKAQNFANATKNNKPSISTRKGPDVVENWKNTKANAQTQLTEQLKKINQ